MIVCRKCSRRYANGTEFCSCGAYLVFDGEHVDDPTGPTTPSPPLTPDPRHSHEHPSSTTSVGMAGPTEPSPWSGLPDEGAWGTPPSAQSTGVDARLPDTPIRTDTTEQVWVESAGRIGDVPCPSCSTPNAPDRQFCRHCGHLLTATELGVQPTVSRTTWWRRLGRSARRRAEQADVTSMAGSARRLSSGGVAGRTMAFRTGAITLVAFSLLAFLGPWRGTVVNGARKVLGGERFEQVEPSDVTALALSETVVPIEFILQPPDNVRDGFANTAWATRRLGAAEPGGFEPPTDGTCIVDAVTETALQFTFEDEPDLTKIAILGGRYAADPQRELYARPTIVELEVAGGCEHIELSDEGELEIHDFNHRNVGVVHLRIADIAATPDAPRTIEISEVIFGG